MIMITSSAFVLAALTMTGLYIKNQNEQSQDDGYTIDFTALEDGADDKFQEIAKNEEISFEEEINQIANSLQDADVTRQQPVTEDDLDYMPVEVGSGQVEIPGLTDNATETEVNAEAINEEVTNEEVINEEVAIEEAALEEAALEEAPVQTPTLNFVESNGLVRPVAGDILMHYSMEGSIYFKTLDQYKYNPAVIFSVAEGTQVSACAEGKVIDIFEDAQIGQAVTLDLGNGYHVTYGQLRDIGVTLDSYVNAGDVIGFVAAPTKYYSLEGSNLYFKMTKNDAAMNPENLFQ